MKMMEPNQELISGYLDGELSQQDEQRVRLQIESHEEWRRLYEDMSANRNLIRASQLKDSDGDDWQEAPRSVASRASRSLGWLFLVSWFVGLLGYGLYEFFTGPEDLLEKLFVAGGLLGFGLLLLSVIMDRVKSLKNDRYRSVNK